eukprot:gnl/Spiro4/5378_TR2740_c0_g1_i1.p1 gnl/Spiro4/5378_TR2740_c0_g1~~gnl/Spiro4/5378_TR2740_c0_g1_i1.p1  ORF type:complete len:490 (+),score=171.78 gnl/Spiro4/5378_TR2740_c0_g1_i1:364-1833(+)
MLLTVPWFLSVFAGRVNFDAQGEGTYRAPSKAQRAEFEKLSPPGNCSLTGTGVNTNPSIRTGAYIMILLCLPYVIIQGPAFFFSCGSSFQPPQEDPCQSGREHWWALAGFLACFVGFVGYLYYQIVQADSDPVATEKIAVARADAIERGLMSLGAVFYSELQEAARPIDRTSNNNPLLQPTKAAGFDSLLLKKFRQYDKDGNNHIDKAEMQLLLHDLGEDIPIDSPEMQVFMQHIDTDNSGEIDFAEFKNAVTIALLQRTQNAQSGKRVVTSPKRAAADVRASTGTATEVELNPRDTDAAAAEGEEDDDDDGEEEEEVPDDLVDLSPEEQQRRIKIRASWMMFVGTAVVLLFSDPMVSVLSEIGNRAHIPPFYVAFVLAPLASNASEVIASFAYASKKTKKTITIALSTLQGACIMNATFCLGIFLILVFARGLAWEFSAETISILAVQLTMALVSMKASQSTLVACLVLMLYPLSLALVALLEHIGLN